MVKMTLEINDLEFSMSFSVNSTVQFILYLMPVHQSISYNVSKQKPPLSFNLFKQLVIF